MRLARPLWLLPLAVALWPSPPAAAQDRPVTRPAYKEPETPLEALQQARAAFEHSRPEDYAMVERLLAPNAPLIENPALRAEAWRLLGITYFYRLKNELAASAFIELLQLEPDEELDPFFVSPRAIAFFDEVKRNAEGMLGPIRERKRAEAEERRRAAEAEAAARRKREQEEEARRMERLRPPTILERRVVQREFWVSLMPFGVGQMQNGEQSLGTALATSQIIAGATSAGSALLIEALRDRSTGKFSPDSYKIADRLRYTKWIGAGVFYALWIGGAIHAAVRFKPEAPAPELVLPSAATQYGPAPGATPAAPPAGPAATPAAPPAGRPQPVPSAPGNYAPAPPPAPSSPAQTPAPPPDAVGPHR